MNVECWAIVIIVLAIAFIFLRSGRKDYFWGIIPVTFVPFAHLIASFSSKPLIPLLKTNIENIYTVFDTVALILACICFGVFSHKFKKRKTKGLYLFICGAFTLTLFMILILTGK